MAQRQQGIALYVVLILILLSMLLALWASRTALFNEISVSNDADYQRTFEAAQAMLQDAELDIRDARPDGGDCILAVPPSDQCREITSVFFDLEPKELQQTIDLLLTAPTGCMKGICTKRVGAQDFWRDPALFTVMTAVNVGARYGQFTGAGTGTASNPILAATGAGAGAWYWVEILPYADISAALLGSTPNSNLLAFAPSKKRPFVYRITAIARGLKPGTQVVLQSTFVRQSIN